MSRNRITKDDATNSLDNYQQFAAINPGDLEAMLKLSEEETVVVVRALAGQIVRGKVAIREPYADLFHRNKQDERQREATFL